ncbi:hypothetical protein ACTMU2_26960 [Cupriavidus basilensis]
MSVTLLSARPDLDEDSFERIMRAHMTAKQLAGEDLPALYRKYGHDKFNLNDRGYLSARPSARTVDGRVHGQEPRRDAVADPARQQVMSASTCTGGCSAPHSKYGQDKPHPHAAGAGGLPAHREALAAARLSVRFADAFLCHRDRRVRRPPGRARRGTGGHHPERRHGDADRDRAQPGLRRQYPL